MRHSRRLATACALTILAAATAASAFSKDVDAAFAAFRDARNLRDSAKAVPDIVESGYPSTGLEAPLRRTALEGSRSFTLLLSPEVFDFSQPVTSHSKGG